MDPVFLALLAKHGIETVMGIIDAWKKAGEPSEAEIREAMITKQPGDYFKPKGGEE